MPHPLNRKFILRWTILLAGLGGSALWATAQSAWLQDRLFGPAVTFHPDYSRNNDPASDRSVLKEFDPQGILHLEDRCHAGHFIVVYEERGSGLLSSREGTLVLDGNHLTTDVTDHVSNSPDRRTQHSLQLNFDHLYMIWAPLEQMRSLQPWPQSNVDVPISAEVETSPLFQEGGGIFHSTFLACAGGQSWYGRVTHGHGGTPAEQARALMSRLLECIPDDHFICS